MVTPIQAMPAKAPALRLAAITAAIFVLSSCGGGGSGSAPAASTAAASTAANTSTSNAEQAFTGADGWTQCAVESEVCMTPGARQVRYGGDGKYAYQNVSGPIG